MNQELKLILELLNEKIDIKTLKKIKKMIEKNINKTHIEKIQEDTEIPVPAVFLLSTKIVKINYNRIQKYLEEFESAMRINMPNATKEDMQLIKLLTMYRMLLHEIYHSKQIYNVFDTDKNDIETEIIRSIYNIDRKKIIEELKFLTRNEIIEYTTALTNEILLPYHEINPLERKAEIQSFLQIRQMLEPIKQAYQKVYDEIYCMEMIKATTGYETNEIPYFKTLEILERLNPDFKFILPYDSKTRIEFLNKVHETEREKLELGLDVKQNTLQSINDELIRILYKKY